MIRKFAGLIFIVVLVSMPTQAVHSDQTAAGAAVTQSLIVELGLRESATPSRELQGWSFPKKIIVRQLPGRSREEWRALAPGVELIFVETHEQALKVANGAQALLGFCDSEMLAASKELFWVQVFSAGVERCVSLPGMKTGSKLLTNGQRIGSPALAEHAISMMMMLARGLDVYHGNQLKGVWQRETGLQRADHVELEGRTALVVGLGGIGTQAAKRAHGLGMNVIATRGSRREGPEYVDYVGLADEVNELAARADVVINTVPLTEKTTGMFDAEFFRAMKSTAFFISVGRGKTTVTDDLLAALNSGEIAGAGLDVTDPEPLPEGHPLWSTPRVIISPHTAGRSDKGLNRLEIMVMENLRRYVAGEPMLSVVDIERGY